MKINIRTITFCILISCFLFSCGNKNAKSKVKKENLTAAQNRDIAISKLPEVTFDKEVFNFGKVKEGEKVNTSFVLTNTGEGDLIITDAKSSCGCTVPTWPKTPVKPGKTAEIKVTFNTNGRKNKQSKNVTLFTNTEKGTEILKISGFVIPKNK